MPGNNGNNDPNPVKIITLPNLDTFKGYIEEKNVQVTAEQYADLPSSKLTDGKSYYITDLGCIYKNGVTYGAGSSSDTTYSLSAGTGEDANKIILTPSTGSPDKVTVPYASNAGTVGGHSVAADVPANAEFTDTTYSDATTSASGLMSAADKTTINGLGTASTKDVATTGDASSSQVVMGNDSRLTDARNAADVSSWAKASTKPTYTASEVGAIASTLKGANNGVAELDSTGKVPTSQLPSYVDDVAEYASTANFPLTGETGKIYVAKDTNKTYRWSGTEYVEISPSLALGETSATAYRGDRGKTAYDHSQTTGNPHGTTISDLGLETANVGSASAGTDISADDITAWSAGTATSVTVSNGVLSITNGTAPSLTYTAKTIPNISVSSVAVVVESATEST